MRSTCPTWSGSSGTPPYYDYHWLARPDLDDVYGAGTPDKVKDLLFGL